MIRLTTDLRSLALTTVAIALAAAAFAGGYWATGSDDVAVGQSGPGMGGAGMGPMGPGMGGMSMGPGMGGMGGAGGGGSSSLMWEPGRNPDPVGPRAHDYAPTASQTYYAKPEWIALADRYELSMEWGAQVTAKWAPVRDAELHYTLAAIGAEAVVPDGDRGAVNPTNIALEGVRLRQRAVDAVVDSQWDDVPPEIRDNLMESARLAAARRTRLEDPDAASTPDLAVPAEGDMQAGAGLGMELTPGASPEEDRELFESFVAIEYENLMRVYLMGTDAAPWFRVPYYHADRSFDEAGRPVLESATPRMVREGAPGTSGTSLSEQLHADLQSLGAGGGGSGGMAGMMMGGGSGGLGEGGREGMMGPGMGGGGPMAMAGPGAGSAAGP